jgi:hypothetical protein
MLWNYIPKCVNIYQWLVNELTLYVRLYYICTQNWIVCFLEKLIQKDHPLPTKPNVIPTKVQRPTPPRHIASAPSVSIS